MSRDANGNFTLPAGNPVISGTAIEATWANPTMTDLGNEITNSLSRTGKGSMLAPLKMPDGSTSAPALTFSGETTSGLHREALADLRMAVTAQDVMRWTAVGVDVWNFIKDEWSPLSNTAGFPAPVVVTDVETIAELNKMYAVDMADLVTKTVLIEDEAFEDGDWFMVKAQNWPSVEGVHFLITTQTEEWESPYAATAADTRSIRVSANGAYTVQKIAGKWSISDGIGESNSALPYTELKEGKVDTTEAVIAAGQDWEGVDYVDPDAIGANPTAKIYPDGSIVGSTDNGSYVKYPNGEITLTHNKVGTIPDITAAAGEIFQSSVSVFYYPIAITVAHAAYADMGFTSVWCSVAGMNTTNISFRAFSALSRSDTSSSDVYVSVQGRWK